MTFWVVLTGVATMSRWSDIIRARRSPTDGEDSSTPWGEWHPVPSTPAVQVRVRRTNLPDGRRDLHLWAYQFRSVLPRRVSFEYRVQLNREGPFDRLARGVEPGEVVGGTVILPTAGPVWIDARLAGEESRPA